LVNKEDRMSARRRSLDEARRLAVVYAVLFLLLLVFAFAPSWEDVRSFGALLALALRD